MGSEIIVTAADTHVGLYDDGEQDGGAHLRASDRTMTLTVIGDTATRTYTVDLTTGAVYTEGNR